MPWVGGGLPYKNDGGTHWKLLTNTLKGTRVAFDRRESKIF